MSRRPVVSRLLIIAGALLVLLTALVPLANSSQTALAAPVPRATTASPSPTGTATPSPNQSESDVEPADDPTDDGSNPTPDQSGTWIALGAAAALSIAAGLVVVLRKR